MTAVLVAVLVALAAISLGLRTTSVLIPRVHPLARFIVSAIIGWAIATAILQLCDRYQVHDLGLGLLVSLAPVGLYDLVKWWFRWKKRTGEQANRRTGERANRRTGEQANRRTGEQ